MKKHALIICGITALLLVGCTKSNIVKNGGPAEPVFETQEGIVLDWSQIWQDLDAQFIDSGDYPFAVSIGGNADPDNKTLGLNLMVHAGTTPEEAVAYANEVVRVVGDEAATQDFSYATSGADSYGGFFDEYTLDLTVLPDGTQASESLWLIDMTIPAGSNQAIEPIEGAVTMEPTEAEEENAEEENAEDAEAAK